MEKKALIFNLAVLAILSGGVAAVSTNINENRIAVEAQPVSKVTTVSEAQSAIDLTHYKRDPVHGYPRNAWKYLKGEEQKLALEEHCNSHLVHRDFALECAE